MGQSSEIRIMDTITAIGYLAASCTTAAFLPQVLRILRTRETEGISLAMYGIFTFGVAMWLVYGLALENWPIILANSVTLMLAGSVLFLTLKHHLSKHPSDRRHLGDKHISDK